jgi:uncharacterized protein
MRAWRLLGPRGLVLRVMVPQTRRERIRGLRGRPMLAVDQAMLLERTRSIHTFGMRFPIAAVRLDRDLIVRSVRPVKPGRLLLPRLRIRHVLECAQDVDLRPGDRLRIVRAPEARRAAAILPGAAPGPGAGCGTDRAPIV